MSKIIRVCFDEHKEVCAFELYEDVNLDKLSGIVEIPDNDSDLQIAENAFLENI